MAKSIITIFTDGSSRGNPGPGGWGAIVVFGAVGQTEYMGRVKELGGSDRHTTNNRMELTAAIEALCFVRESAEIKNLSKHEDGLKNKVTISIHSDSRYVINGATKWIFGWQRKNWVTSQKQEVLNRDLWEKIARLIDSFTEHTTVSILWQYVGGHVGIPANERCDEIATSFAGGVLVDLYDGLKKDYRIDTEQIYEATATDMAKVLSPKKRSQAKAYSYVSFIDGKISTYATWTECEAEVRGKSGVRYKKALDADEERAIIADWTASGN
jgi:ribonuclease HI